ncbi:MAG: IS66 family insertion sequence element accessory protein TnpA [Bryobacteraceae bacterium]
MDIEGHARKRKDWRPRISEQQQSGLTVKAFCQKHGVGEALLVVESPPGYCSRK